MFTLTRRDVLAVAGGLVIGAASRAVGQDAAAAGGGILAYAWHPAPGVEPMVTANMNRTWIDQVEGVSAVLKGRPAGRRALFLAHDHPGLWGPAGKSLREVIADGPFRTAEHRAWLAGAFAFLARAGAAPDFIVLDNETAPTLWAYPDAVAAMREVLADPRSRAKLPNEMVAFEAADYAFGRPKMRDAFTAFGRASMTWHAAALRDVADEARKAFGRAVPVVNWLDHASDRPAHDGNGWPVPKASVGGWSAPVLYVDETGIVTQGREKRPRWNKFVLAINNLRAAAAGGAPVLPWVSHPSFNGDRDKAAANPWLWVELQKHVAATGVRSVLYWNPREAKAADDDAVAAQTWAGLTPAPKLQGSLPDVPYDAEEVVTGKVVTKYKDYRE